MGNLIKGIIIFKDNYLNSNQEFIIEIFCRIFAVICSIPSILSIITILLSSKEIYMKIHAKIQIMMCISFIGMESPFLFPSTKDEINFTIFIPRIQSTAAFTFTLLTLLFQVMHAFVAYKYFVSPNALSKPVYKFFILVFPWIFSLFFGLHSFFISDLTVHYHYVVFPEDNITKNFSDIAKLVLFLLVIFFTLLLLFKIKKTLLQDNEESFAKKKFSVYRKKLLGYILGTFLAYHQMFVRKIFQVASPGTFDKFGFQLYFYLTTTLSVLVFWYIYIYNINLLRRFLILIHLHKKEEYEDQFDEEEKINNCNLEDTIADDSKVCAIGLAETKVSDNNDDMKI